MAVTRYGQISIGAFCPVALSSINGLLPELQGKLAGLLNVSAALTISLPNRLANIQALGQVVASLTAAVEGPVVTLQIGAIAGLISQLQAQIVALQAVLGLLGASVGVYGYDGPVRSFGSEMSAELGAEPNVTAHALTVIGTDPTAIAAIRATFVG